MLMLWLGCLNGLSEIDEDFMYLDESELDEGR